MIWESNLLVLHCFASERQALNVWPGYFSNSFSRSSIRARQSAAEPAKPHTTLSWILRSFLAVFLKTVGPNEICPSAIRATYLPLRTLSIVVLWKSCSRCVNLFREENVVVLKLDITIADWNPKLWVFLIKGIVVSFVRKACMLALKNK
jgi:hypothetical protein